jgi:NADPH:quinone reductase-like Zn-dependent oxidoreductase
VCGLVAGGGYAEYCTVAEANALPIPGDLSAVEAAGLPETFFTVWTNVFTAAGWQPGETLLVHGGSSGIGTTAIMMAKIWGARIFATAGSADKCRACEDLGAERAINYREEDFVEAVLAATDKRGADVILDMVGGDYVARNLKAAAATAASSALPSSRAPRSRSTSAAHVEAADPHRLDPAPAFGGGERPRLPVRLRSISGRISHPDASGR